MALLKDCKREHCCLCAVVVSPARPTAVSHQMRATESARSVDAKRDERPPAEGRCGTLYGVTVCMLCEPCRCCRRNAVSTSTRVNVAMQAARRYTTQRGTRCNVAHNDATWHTTMQRVTQRCNRSYDCMSYCLCNTLCAVHSTTALLSDVLTYALTGSSRR